MTDVSVPTVIFSTAELAQELGKLALFRLGYPLGVSRKIGVRGEFEAKTNRLLSVVISIEPEADSVPSQQKEETHAENQSTSAAVPSAGASPRA